MHVAPGALARGGRQPPRPAGKTPGDVLPTPRGVQPGPPLTAGTLGDPGVHVTGSGQATRRAKPITWRRMLPKAFSCDSQLSRRWQPRAGRVEHLPHGPPLAGGCRVPSMSPPHSKGAARFPPCPLTRRGLPGPLRLPSLMDGWGSRIYRWMGVPSPFTAPTQRDGDPPIPPHSWRAVSLPQHPQRDGDPTPSPLRVLQAAPTHGISGV